jgi:hypothetical protein
MSGCTLTYGTLQAFGIVANFENVSDPLNGFFTTKT